MLTPMFHMSAMPLFFTLIVIGLPVICITVLILAAILKSSGGKQRQASDAEETRLIQEIHRDMNRLEDRIEALETIIIDHERSKGKP